jgi:hypothetical protein
MHKHVHKLNCPQVFTINHYYEETLISIKTEAKTINDSKSKIATGQRSIQDAVNLKKHTEELEERLELDPGFSTHSFY